MHYKHNDPIMLTKKVNKENILLTYKLFDSGTDYISRYSVLISMADDKGNEEDFYISDFASNRLAAFILFDKLYKNTVMPCEVEEIYSDGFMEIL